MQSVRDQGRCRRGHHKLNRAMLKELPLLESERLQMRARQARDLQASWETDTDITSLTYIGVERWNPDMQRYYRWFMQRMEHDSWPRVGGFWMIAEKASGRVMGWCGLFPMPKSGPMEIGYCLHPAARGKGVAQEAARRVLAHGFEVLEFDPICGVTDPSNWRSQQVLQAIGLRREGQMLYHGKWLPFFRLDRRDYSAL